jgi:hypothetical protein
VEDDVPSVPTTSREKSRVPADEPAERMTRSFSATASESASEIRSGSSGTMG